MSPVPLRSICWPTHRIALIAELPSPLRLASPFSVHCTLTGRHIPSHSSLHGSPESMHAHEQIHESSHQGKQFTKHKHQHRVAKGKFGRLSMEVGTESVTRQGGYGGQGLHIHTVWNALSHSFFVQPGEPSNACCAVSYLLLCICNNVAESVPNMGPCMYNSGNSILTLRPA